MSDTPKDGGPAFPYTLLGDKKVVSAGLGMSLRDYFAAHALKVIVLRPHPETAELEQFARCAYAFADAMIEARKPKP